MSISTRAFDRANSVCATEFRGETPQRCSQHSFFHVHVRARCPNVLENLSFLCGRIWCVWLFRAFPSYTCLLCRSEHRCARPAREARKTRQENVIFRAGPCAWCFERLQRRPWVVYSSRGFACFAPLLHLPPWTRPKREKTPAKDRLIQARC